MLPRASPRPGPQKPPWLYSRGVLHLVRLCLAAALLGAGLPRAAAQPEQPPAKPADPAAATTATPELADTARSSVRAIAHWLAGGVDRWFGDQPFEQGGQVRDAHLSLNLLKRQGETTDVDLRFNARWRLPNLEKKTYLFLGRDDPDELISDQPGALSSPNRPLAPPADQLRFFAGVGRTLNNHVDVRLGLRGALKPYAQARYRTQWALGDRGLAEFRQTLFWSVDDRAGTTSSVSCEHVFSPVLAARWLSSATLTQASRRVGWSSLIGGYRAFGPHELLSVEALVSGRQGSGVKLTDYGAQLRWEQPLHRSWLVGSLVVGHFWPRPDAQGPRRSAWAGGISLRMHL